MATLIAPDQSLPLEDAQMIKKACQGWGTDEKVIISILGHRTVTQRNLIRLAYEEIYQEDLIDQLKSELSGDFQRVVCHWVLDDAERDAVLANTALNKSKPDYRVIVEIACIKSPEELLAVKRAYHNLYKHSFEEDVAFYTSGDIQKLLVAVVSSFRYDGDEVNERLAYSEANILHGEIELINSPNHHEEMIRILCTRSKAQLIATFNHYKDNHAKSITKSLSGDPTNELLTASRIAIRCIKNPKNYFAKVLRNAINKVGTDEDAVSRVIITRAEKDLKEIKEVVFKRNNISLDQAVAKDTTGDYKAFLLALLGSEE